MNLLSQTLPRFGVTTSFVKPRDLDGFRAAIKPNTRLIIGETIGNPGLEVLDIPSVAAIAHPVGGHPAAHRQHVCDALSVPAARTRGGLVMNSVTKWIGGHGIAIGGASSTADGSTGGPPKSIRC